MRAWRRLRETMGALALGLGLIAAASMVLLASDWSHRRLEQREAPRIGPWRLSFLSYTETSFVEESLEGVRAQLAAHGLLEGRDVALSVASAQGDMAALTTMLEVAAGDRADLILLNSTVALQAAVNRVRRVPVVFGNVANPVLAGAGTSFADHAENITGVATMGDFAGMARLLRECLPRARRVGTLFVPGEINSVFNRDSLQAALAEVGVELVSVPVASSAELPDAARALCASRLDAVCQVTANIIDTGFPGLAGAAAGARLPVFVFSSGLVERGGAAVALARDYEQVGRDMVDIALRIRAGERPAEIPFTLPSRTVLVVSPANAAAAGLVVPPAVLARADRVVQP